MARFAAIDIGSNAMRLRIVEADQKDLVPGVPASSVWREVAAMRAPVRLGKGVFLTGALAPSAISAAAGALRQFREAMDEAKVDHYRAVATSAVREAENADVLVERAQREAGVHIDIIEGVEEARLVQLAVQRRLRLGDRRALLIDIGGGSTELTVLDKNELYASQSLPVGTVRLLEAFLEKDIAIDARHTELIREFVERVFVELSPEISEAEPDVLVATGGNIDTLATLCPRPTPDGPGIDVRAARKFVEEVASLSVRERMSRYGLREDRADTILPAAEILFRVARPLDHEVVLAPGTGLKDGILEELVDRHFAVWSVSGEEHAIGKACLRLGRRYHFDEGHGLHVAKLATQIFDDLRPLHGLGPRERLLLTASAILHDVGDFIRYEGHHKHSFYVIQHSDIMGLTTSERGIVANVARYHRKGPPEPAHPNFRDLSRENRATVRTLAALLRLGDALDREHLSKVSSVRASTLGGRLRLEVQGVQNRELEMWTVARKSELFRAVFDLDVDVVDAAPTSGKASKPPLGPLPTADDD